MMKTRERMAVGECGDEVAGVADMQADVLQPGISSTWRSALAAPFQKGSAPRISDVGPPPRLRRHMLAAAEADL